MPNTSRRRVDENPLERHLETALQGWNAREEHLQHILEEPLIVKDFNGAQFIAYIGADIKIKSSGGADITFSVPPSFTHLTLDLYKVTMLPLSVDIQLWKPFREAVENGMV